jgi:predicted MFS family arabinose efflux permease
MSALLCGLSTNFTMLLITRLIAGVGAAAVIPLSMAWIGDVVPYQMRQPILARFMVGQILGLSVGAFVGGLAADQLGWRMPFFGVALIFLGAGVALLHLNRRLPAHARAVRIGHGPAIPRMIKEFKQILARPWVRIVLLCVFLEGACIFGALAFIASHVHRTFGMSLTTAGTLVMLFGFGGLLFAVASGSLVPRLGEAGMTWVGGGLAASFLLTIGLAPAWWWTAPACFMVGVGFYMLHNTLQINATQMAPERRGAAVSLFASCFYLGQAAGVGAAGLVVEWGGTSPILVAGALGVLLVAMGFFRGLQSRPTS